MGRENAVVGAHDLLAKGYYDRFGPRLPRCYLEGRTPNVSCTRSAHLLAYAWPSPPLVRCALASQRDVTLSSTNRFLFLIRAQEVGGGER
eukprot:1791844-Pyramimonas_sp.AAC.1